MEEDNRPRKPGAVPHQYTGRSLCPLFQANCCITENVWTFFSNTI